MANTFRMLSIVKTLEELHENVSEIALEMGDKLEEYESEHGETDGWYKLDYVNCSLVTLEETIDNLYKALKENDINE